MYHFFAFMSRMKHIHRWPLMRNTWQEDIAQHSLQTAMTAHALALMHNTRFGGGADPERAVTLALYHEAPEVITGDLPTPVKYFDSEVRSSYRRIEDFAAQRLHGMLPDDLKPDFALLLLEPEKEPEWPRVKAADRICAYIKCVEELKAGNDEFRMAEKRIRADLEKLCQTMPEVRAYMEEFLPSFSVTLDELNSAP